MHSVERESPVYNINKCGLPHLTYIINYYIYISLYLSHTLPPLFLFICLECSYKNIVAGPQRSFTTGMKFFIFLIYAMLTPLYLQWESTSSYAQANKFPDEPALFYNTDPNAAFTTDRSFGNPNAINMNKLIPPLLPPSHPRRYFLTIILFSFPLHASTISFISANQVAESIDPVMLRVKDLPVSCFSLLASYLIWHLIIHTPLQPIQSIGPVFYDHELKPASFYDGLLPGPVMTSGKTSFLQLSR
jgi:hypothetical protein